MLSQPVVDLLKALELNGAAEFKKVAGAADFEAARKDLTVPPAAFVIPLSDTAKPNLEATNVIEQQVMERFGVVLALQNVRDMRGEAVNAELERLRHKVIQALLGFMPGPEYAPVQYGGGQLLLLLDGIIYWQLNFLTGYFERKVI